MDKVSVIIPTFNSEKHLGAALDSVLAQTYPEIEIIIVDDGSRDHTADLVQNYQSRYSNKIFYCYQSNQGPAPARNNGLKQSTGKYIAFLDADDAWLPTKIEKQIQCFYTTPGVGFVYCDNFFVNEEGKEISNYVRKIKLVEGNILADLFNDFFLITSSLIMKRECFESTGYFDQTLLVGEDYEYFLRLSKNYMAGVCREKLFLRRVHAQSLSRQDFCLDARNDINTLRNFLKSNPSFYQHHQQLVKNRLGDYYFNFSYRLLEEGRNITALQNLFQAMNYERSIRVFKNLILCFLPPQGRKYLKRQCYPSI